MGTTSSERLGTNRPVFVTKNTDFGLREGRNTKTLRGCQNPKTIDCELKVGDFRILAPPEGFGVPFPLNPKSALFVTKTGRLMPRRSQPVIPMGTCTTSL